MLIIIIIFVNAFRHYNHSNGTIERLTGSCSTENILEKEIYHVTLYKVGYHVKTYPILLVYVHKLFQDSIYDDYGFSVSDGLYVKGVYINRIRKGGPADIVGLLRPYDRIIQVSSFCIFYNIYIIIVFFAG